MRLLIGMVLGVILTIGVAFVVDNRGITAATDASSGPAVHRKMVNWDVVNDNWRAVQRRARSAWAAMSQKTSS